MIKKNFIQNIFSCLIFLLLVGFSIYHAGFGVDLTDEGTYLATSMRLTMGDLPFRDESKMGVTAYNILLSPIFRYFPKVTLFQMRLVGILIHSAGYLVLFLLFRKFAPPLIVALFISVIYLVNNYFGIWTPSYNLLASIFSMVAFCLLMFGTTREKGLVFFSALSGVIFAFAVINYFSLVIFIPIPLIYSLFLTRNSKKSGEFFKSAIFFTSGLLLALLFASILLFQNRLINDLLNVWKIDGGTRGGMVLSKLNFFSSSLFHNLSNSTILLLSILAPFPYFLVFILVSLRILPEGTNLQLFYFSIYSGLLSLLIMSLNKKTAKNLLWITTAKASIVWGMILSIIFSISSNEKTETGLMGISLVFTASLIYLYRIANPKIRVSLILTLIVFLYSAFNYNFRTVYRDGTIPQLTRSFSFPKLAGIKSLPGKVEKLETLLEYLSGRVNPGDYLLAYNNFPLLYFLIQTRPAYGYAWIHGSSEPEFIRVKLLEKMISENRIPKYVVRVIAPPGYDWRNPLPGGPVNEDPLLNEFVFGNYVLEKTIYPFEVWKRKM